MPILSFIDQGSLNVLKKLKRVTPCHNSSALGPTKPTNKEKKRFKEQLTMQRRSILGDLNIPLRSLIEVGIIYKGEKFSGPNCENKAERNGLGQTLSAKDSKSAKSPANNKYNANWEQSGLGHSTNRSLSLRIEENFANNGQQEHFQGPKTPKTPTVKRKMEFSSVSCRTESLDPKAQHQPLQRLKSKQGLTIVPFIS